MAQSNPFCTSCGSELRPGASFCGKCGTTIEQGNSNPQPAYKNPRQEAFEEYENDYVGRAVGNSNPQPRYNNSQGNGPHGGKPSAAWWLLPIFFSFIGGIIAWACVKDRDPRMAKNCLILGIILSVVPFAIAMLISFIGLLPGMYSFDMMR
jgi:hypothetical protein